MTKLITDMACTNPLAQTVKSTFTESLCVAELFKLYKEKIANCCV